MQYLYAVTFNTNVCKFCDIGHMYDLLSDVSSVVDSIPLDILKAYAYKERSTLFLFLKLNEGKQLYLTYVWLFFLLLEHF